MDIEEKKAIEWVKNNLEETIKLGQKYGLQEAIKKQTIILNLIEKQQKEIEELKDTNKKLYEIGKQNAIQELINNDYISKDKIKAKIEELNKQEQDLQNNINDEEREEYSDANISWELMDIHIRREVLQLLLEEKE